MSPPSKRRLAAVLFSDIKGYSSQMGANEERTLVRLRQHNTLFREQVGRHGGRVVKTVGDAFMVEFASAVDAVACALDVQRALAAWNTGRAEADRIEVRIGVHAGDVVVEDEDLFGETVNLAARLEGKAPPGGVCITLGLLEQVRRKVDAEASDLGFHQLKNLPEPARLFALTPSATRLELAPAVEPEAPPASRRLPRVPVVGSALAAALAVGIAIAVLLARPEGQTPQLGAAPARGGTVRVGYLVPRGSLETFPTIYSLGGLALNHVLEWLVETNEDGEPEPGVLVRFDAVGDGTVLELELRKGVRFHDHRCFPAGKGREATAEDVAWSIDVASRALRLDMPLVGLSERSAGAAASIRGVEVVGPRLVKLTLVRRAPFADLDLQDIPLLPRELERCDDPRQMQWPVGTGPFRFARPPAGERLDLVRNEAWWRTGPGGQRLPFVDGLELRHVPEPLGGIQQLAAGQLDVLSMLPDQSGPVLDGVDKGRPRMKPELARPGLSVGTEPPGALTIMLTLQVVARADGALERADIRKALGIAVDRSTLVPLLGASLIPFGRFLAPWHLGASLTLRPLERDLPEARRLLAKAGHPNGAGLPEIALGAYPDRTKLAEAIREQTAEVGLKVRVVETSPENAERAFRERQIDAWIVMLFGPTRGSEPWPFLRFPYEESGGGIAAPPEFRTLVDRIVAEPDRSERARLYGDLEQHLVQQLPVIPLGLVTRNGPTELFVVGPRAAELLDPVTGRLRHGTWEMFSRLRLRETEVDSR